MFDEQCPFRLYKHKSLSATCSECTLAHNRQAASSLNHKVSCWRIVGENLLSLNKKIIHIYRISSQRIAVILRDILRKVSL